MDESELFNTFAAKCGETAYRKLWAIANSEAAPMPQRERLLQWFAEMALGKPRTMEAAPGGTPGGCGLIILPAVVEQEQ